jgi:hypothetical protein
MIGLAPYGNGCAFVNSIANDEGVRCSQLLGHCFDTAQTRAIAQRLPGPDKRLARIPGDDK